MTPTDFEHSNCIFGPPKDLEKSQCMSIHAYSGQVLGGSVDGSHVVVVAWRPNEQELKDIAKGKPIFISMMGGLAPHFLTTNFNQAITPI